SEAVNIDSPPGGELVKDWPERRAQHSGTPEQAVDWLGRVLQLLHVRQEPACFDRVEKARGRFRFPGLEGRCVGQSIKGVVDLDRVEARAIVGEPSGLWQVGRIERSAPMSILPTRTADTCGSFMHGARSPSAGVDFSG